MIIKCISVKYILYITGETKGQNYFYFVAPHHSNKKDREESKVTFLLPCIYHSGSNTPESVQGAM